MTLIFEDTPLFLGNQSGIASVKPDDYTIIGNPVITDDGIASGFSTGNYITIPDLHLENADSWEINWEGIILGNSLDTSLVGVFSGNGIMIEESLTGNSIDITLFLSSEPSSWNIANGSINQKVSFPNAQGHNFKVVSSFSGSQYTLEVMDLTANEYKAITPVSSTAKIYQSPQTLGSKRGERTFSGSIDLNAFKIYVDGSLVYQPCLKIPYTLNEYGLKIPDSRYKDRVIDAYEQGLIEVYFK